MKVLFLSFTPPLPSWGGSMTFYRHFIERDDFDTLTMTNSDHLDDYALAYEPIRIPSPRLWDRITRTRFLPWLSGIQSLYGDHYLLPGNVIAKSREFQPDVVFTVAGSWDWTALAAKRVARKLGVPLVASFNDWYDYGWFPHHPLFHRAIEKRFRRFYREADLALCTSEGMKEALGPHPNVHVWYPTGALMPKTSDRYQPVEFSPEHHFTVFFGGSLGDWYGQMLEALVRQCQISCPHVQFRIYGSMQSWSDEFESWAMTNGVFRGKVAFDQLRNAALKADLLLLPMGFDASCAHVERTSFKTKFLDYLSFRRPILVWGPDYCSAVRTAREFDAAECVTDIDPMVCADAIQRLVDSPGRRNELMVNAQNMYEDRFHPDRIHEGLVMKMEDLVRNQKKC